jgi:predicted carbohydrate-binding protein with CBM5 and CBM33 domain
LAADGFNNCEIADALGIDETTVRRDWSANADSPVEFDSPFNEQTEYGSANADSKASRRAEREAELAAKRRALPTRHVRSYKLVERLNDSHGSEKTLGAQNVEVFVDRF